MIQPSSIVKLLSNVYLDADYTNTYDYKKDEQFNAMNAKTKHTLNNYTYQRVELDKIRVSLSIEDVFDCNYMMFKNEKYENKWFYAFITDIKYINDATTEITYDIDVIQSFFLTECFLDECFVEREHSSTDNVGDNIVEENLCLGEYVFDETYTKLVDLSDLAVLVSVSKVRSGATVDGKYIDGIYGANEVWVFKGDDVQHINSFLQQFVSDPNNVSTIYTAPKIFFPMLNEQSYENGYRLEYGASSTNTTFIANDVNTSITFGSYTPKNKKLLTYPFNYFHITDGCGNTLPLRYEFFKNLTPVLEISGCANYPVTATVRPLAYKGARGYDALGGWGKNYTELLETSPFPQCSWSADAYQTWVGQNVIPIALNSLATVGQLASGYYIPTTLLSGAERSQRLLSGSVNAGVGGVTSMLSDVYKASISADVARGNTKNGNVALAHNMLNIYGGRCRITEQYARIIDGYFTKYGYAVKAFKTPNIRTRPYWNYVKTNGAEVYANIPNKYIDKIKSILDRGITFWHVDGTIGNYSLNNAPV